MATEEFTYKQYLAMKRTSKLRVMMQKPTE